MARLEASTRARELARYTGGPMVDTAYRLASSEEYAEALEPGATGEGIVHNIWPG